MPWFRRFADPITLADDGKMFTLQDAANYIAALPKAERDAAVWKIAMEALILVAERNGAELLARIAMQMALNDGKPPPAPAPQKPAKKFRVVH